MEDEDIRDHDELQTVWSRQMRSYLDQIGTDWDRQLAEEFEVAHLTVRRWRLGTANPHWRLAKQVAYRARDIAEAHGR